MRPDQQEIFDEIESLVDKLRGQLFATETAADRVGPKEIGDAIYDMLKTSGELRSKFDELRQRVRIILEARSK